MQRQDEAGVADPFAQSERVVGSVVKNIEASREQQRTVLEKIDRNSKELQRVNTDLDKLEAKYSTFSKDAKRRSDERDQLAQFIQDCENRQMEVRGHTCGDFGCSSLTLLESFLLPIQLRGECGDWKRRTVVDDLKRLRRIASEELARQKGFTKKVGTTPTRRQVAERTLMLKRRMASVKSLPPLEVSVGSGLPAW